MCKVVSVFVNGTKLASYINGSTISSGVAAEYIIGSMDGLTVRAITRRRIKIIVYPRAAARTTGIVRFGIRLYRIKKEKARSSDREKVCRQVTCRQPS